MVYGFARLQGSGFGINRHRNLRFGGLGLKAAALVSASSR